MFGKLSMASVPWNEPIIMVTCLFILVGMAGVLVLITYLKRWQWLWEEWLTSVDHKRVGIMYTLLALVMLLRGFSDAVMMRSQQALAGSDARGFLPPEHYDQVFSAHGTIMIFFMAMPFVVGLMNFVVPLQIGARDVAFPVMNALSFWLTAAGALLVNVSLGVGEFSRAGWLAYPPLSELAYSPGVGVDYYLWALQLSGLGTLLSGINLVTTIMRCRAPGMRLSYMPIFSWTALATNMLIVASFPILTGTFAMLLLDRYLGMHFFTNEAGGSPMMYINLIWMWGHPEVYILAVPCFGIFSEVIATFSGKPLFGYRSMVIATMAITLMAFTTWLHHFFTMGSGADVNTFFGITTMLISIPTGVKIFNWLFTMYGGRVRFTAPVLWTIGFMITFTIGGMTGVLMSVPPVDFVLHNSLFLIAHFHNVIIGAVVFGCMAGYTYWFPKAFGFTLDERLGKMVFWCWFIGFYFAFVPLYALGILGMPRRMNHYDNPEWTPYLYVAVVGVALIALGIVLQIAQLIVSIRTRHLRRDVTGDPWDARTLEWSTASPPPVYNFALSPRVTGIDAHWHAPKSAGTIKDDAFEPIEMPNRSALGFVTAFFSVVGGFAMIWHIFWLGALSLFAAVAFWVWSSWDENDESPLAVDDIKRMERLSRLRAVGA